MAKQACSGPQTCGDPGPEWSAPSRTFWPGRGLVLRFPIIYHVTRALFRPLLNRVRATPWGRRLTRRAPWPGPHAAAETFSAKDLETWLRDCGLGRGDLLMVHSSLDHLGSFSGTCPELIDALLAVIGPEGTLCMPAFPWFMEKGPDGVPVFDLQRTPTQMGLLPESFRRRKGVLRSRQKRSVAALGPLAAVITGSHHLDPFPCGNRSPYAMFAQFKGKLLFLGVSPYEYNTMFHCCEDMLNGWPRLRAHQAKPASIRVRDAEGNLAKIEHFPLRYEIEFLNRPALLQKYFTRGEIVARPRWHTDFWLVDADRFLARLLQLGRMGITQFGYRFPDPDRLPPLGATGPEEPPPGSMPGSGCQPSDK